MSRGCDGCHDDQTGGLCGGKGGPEHSRALVAVFRWEPEHDGDLPLEAVVLVPAVAYALVGDAHDVDEAPRDAGTAHEGADAAHEGRAVKRSESPGLKQARQALELGRRVPPAHHERRLEVLDLLIGCVRELRIRDKHVVPGCPAELGPEGAVLVKQVCEAGAGKELLQAHVLDEGPFHGREVIGRWPPHVPRDGKHRDVGNAVGDGQGRQVHLVCAISCGEAKRTIPQVLTTLCWALCRKGAIGDKPQLVKGPHSRCTGL